MIKIAVDAMGSDKGSSIVVEAVKKFMEDYKDVEFTVYGKKEELASLDGLVKIVDCPDVMGMEDGALQIMRKKFLWNGLTIRIRICYSPFWIMCAR